MLPFNARNGLRCEYCEAEFSVPLHLKAHYRSVHGRILKPQVPSALIQRLEKGLGVTGCLQACTSSSIDG